MLGEPTEHQIQANGVCLAYYEWNADAGPEAPTVLLIHATGFHARCWDRAVAALPEGLRVIAVDQRGHGRSENTGPIPDWRLPADDISALVEGLDLKNIIGAGHSMGGHCVTQVAARLPGRFTRLVLVDPVMMDPNHYTPGAFNDRGRPEDFPVAKRRNHWVSWEEMFERFKDRHPYSLWRADVLEDYCRYGLVAREAKNGEHDGYELACPPVIESSIYVTSAGTDIYDMVRSVATPVTVLRAKMRDFSKAAVMDFAASPTWEGLAAEFKNGTDVYLPELSHFIPMQDPELVARYIVGE